MKRARAIVLWIWFRLILSIYRGLWSYMFGRIYRKHGRKILVAVSVWEKQPSRVMLRDILEGRCGPQQKRKVFRGYVSVRGIDHGVDSIYVKTIRRGGSECDPHEELITEIVSARARGIEWCWGWDEADADALRAVWALS